MEMKNPHVIWAAVIIVFIMVAGAVTLVALDKDVTVILSLAGLVAVPVLSAFGVAVYQKLDQVKEASNGNLSRVIDMQQKTQAQLTQLALLLPAQQQAETDAALIAEKASLRDNQYTTTTETHTTTTETAPRS
jgi:hypothetical protein